MIDITTETLVPVLRVREYVPSGRFGKRLSKAIVFRWIGRGVKGGIILESVKIGGARYTTLEAIQRFVEAQNGATSEKSSVNKNAETRVLKAASELSKRGI